VGSGIRNDYKSSKLAERPPARGVARRHVAAVTSVAVLAGIIALWVDGPAEGRQITEAATVASELPLPAPASLPTRNRLAAQEEREAAEAALADAAAALATEPPEIPSTRMMLEVGPGDSLDGLFRRNGLSVNDLHRLLKLGEAAPHLKRIRPGDMFEIVHDGEAVLALTRRVDETRSLFVEAGEQGFTVSYLDHPVEVRLVRAQGSITSSFYAAGLAAGLSDATIMRLAGIYAWDIDFALDIRRDDWFAVLYEEIWQNGEKLREGEIVAAEFSNQASNYRAVRFPDPDGRARYYTPAGDSMRKAFLRAPVDFTRVSSNFNPNRLHPILKVRRPHQGVDYAARTGTPIMAAGDGRVVSAGPKGGYGNTVVLQHGGNVTTLYAHMSRIASTSRAGRRVRQGDVIGYVGRTGLATAPHLHYEYRANGVHRNPRTVELPKAEPVPAARRAEFAATTAPLLAELDGLGHTRLAAAD
jgi:murein DD-endopeptidase MepM/ murein hydrolase activator NlpD